MVSGDICWRVGTSLCCKKCCICYSFYHLYLAWLKMGSLLLILLRSDIMMFAKRIAANPSESGVVTESFGGLDAT